jgi:hypothetical protein
MSEKTKYSPMITKEKIIQLLLKHQCGVFGFVEKRKESLLLLLLSCLITITEFFSIDPPFPLCIFVWIAKWYWYVGCY